ncbi:MAG: YigZ family protein [Saprospiraceae bacterium]|nr:YigZ family protein [Saprospiraceae bacterium]
MEKTATAIVRDRGSRFLGFALPVSSKSEFEEHLTQFRKEHPKANHHCYAYRLGTSGSEYRANDDGEPSGTAGKPILGQIDSFQVTNILIIVVRYFGGTKLGTSGLIQAYRETARLTLENADIVKKEVRSYYRISFGYEKMGPIMSYIKKSGAQIEDQSFEEEPWVEFSFPIKSAEKSNHDLGARISGVIPEIFDPEEHQDGWSIQFLESQ